MSMWRLKAVIDSEKFPFCDKVCLPHSILDDIVARNIDFSEVLMFKLSGLHECTVGVREFSSNEGEIVLPRVVSSIVGSSDILCELVSVPLGEKLILEPQGTVNGEGKLTQFDNKTLRNDFFFKSLLESRLSTTYTTLSKDQVLLVSSQANGEPSDYVYQFKVVDVSPQQTVCIVNTDLDLEIVTEVSRDADGNIVQEEESPDLVSIGVNEVVCTTAGQKYVLEYTGDISICIENDADESHVLFIANDEFVSSCMFDRSTAETCSKVSPSPMKNTTIFDVQSEKLYFVANGEFNFQVKVSKSENPSESHTLCNNCGTLIAKSSYFLHEVHCVRNTKTCGVCHKVYKETRQIPAQHWHEHDAVGNLYYGDTQKSRDLYLARARPSVCECGLSVDSQIALGKHKRVCPLSPHQCRYCHLIQMRGESTAESQYYGISGHELQCGLKTVECYKCHAVLKRLELAHHLDMHEFQRKNRPKVLPMCKNQLCTRLEPNEYGLCEVCFGPFYASDLDARKFSIKLERKYVIQATRGCGTTYCKNPECASSGLLSNDGPAKAIKRAQELAHCEEKWLCVDESTTKRKLLIDAMAEQYIEYDRSWLCKAVGQADPHQWLSENAAKMSD